MTIRRILAELQPFVIWALAGGLASSAWWNVNLMHELAAQKHTEKRATALAVSVPELGLSPEQLDRIRGCGMT